MKGQVRKLCPIGERQHDRTTAQVGTGRTPLTDLRSASYQTGQAVGFSSGHVRSRIGRTKGGYLYPPCPVSGVRPVSVWRPAMKSTRTLFDTAPRFDGASFDPLLDQDRLSRQMGRVFEYA
jgi:hypothetical protein